MRVPFNQSEEKRLFLLFDVPFLSQQLPEPALPLGKRGPRDKASKPNSIVFLDLVQHADGSPVPEENPLGIYRH